MLPIFIFFTCEHARNDIPTKYKSLFKSKEKVLLTHRGFDHGSKEIGKAFGDFFNSPVIYGKFSRLLIDLNRSQTHKTLFSEMTNPLPKSEKIELIELYHRPHWEEIEKLISDKINKGYIVIHIGVHSFTPALFNEVRNAEIGLLYNSTRKKEVKMAINWQKIIRQNSQLRVRRNYPYNGKSDGLTSKMRKKFSSQDYLGFEIEINHAILKNKNDIKRISQLLSETLKMTIDSRERKQIKNENH